MESIEKIGLAKEKAKRDEIILLIIDLRIVKVIPYLNIFSEKKMNLFQEFRKLLLLSIDSTISA